MKATDPSFKFKIGRKPPSGLRLVKTNCDGSDIFVDINDHIGHQVFTRGSFDKAIYNFFRVNKLKNITVFDIGANIGTVCIPLAQLNDVKVVAFEPADRNYSLLVLNNYINGNKLTTIPIGISNNIHHTVEVLQLNVNKVNSGSSSLLPTWNVNRGDVLYQNILVSEMDTLSDLYQLSKPNIIKLDIEGNELNALFSMRSVLDEKVILLMEWRPDLIDESTGSALLEFFADYKIMCLHASGLISDSFDEKQKYENVLIIHTCNDTLKNLKSVSKETLS
ncbi:FkbM family methyltransferase [Rhodobacterales bacterium FZCC0083]|nr:FkbM family methyltransferase [Rhodobacterales bacterium FZCC0083]